MDISKPFVSKNVMGGKIKELRSSIFPVIVLAIEKRTVLRV